MMNKMLMVGTGISSIGQVPILGGGRIKSLSQLIKSMFSKGEAGFAYDMSDMSTLFQDASGTIPVTAAGQPVGLILDKSKGLAYSAELFTKFDSTLSSTLSSTTTPTVVTSTVASGIYGAVINVNFMPEVYKISFAWEGNTTGREMFLSMPDGNNISLGFGVTGTYDKFIRFKSQGGLAIMRSPNGMGQTFTISSVSVKRLLGNHAYQTVSASRPILRQTPILANEYINNGAFTSNVAGWGTYLGDVTHADGAAVLTVTSNGHPQLSQSCSAIAGKIVHVSCDFKNRVGGATAKLALYSSNTGDVATKESSATSGALSFIAQVPSNFNGHIICMLTSAVVGNNVTFDNVSIRDVTGYLTDQNYLQFDGVDDFLQTANIDFTATDKVSLFAGVRKLSDVNTALVVESSVKVDLNAGAFNLAAPSSTGLNKFSSDLSYGTNYLRAENTETKYSAPISAVLTSHLQRTATLKSVKLRINGVLGAQIQQAPSGSGMGNYPLFIGRRGGAELPFTGNIYSLIGISRLTTDAETLALEKAIAKATGVTLNV